MPSRSTGLGELNSLIHLEHKVLALNANARYLATVDMLEFQVAGDLRLAAIKVIWNGRCAPE